MNYKYNWDDELNISVKNGEINSVRWISGFSNIYVIFPPKILISLYHFGDL
jgi:hypothetical protein